MARVKPTSGAKCSHRLYGPAGKSGRDLQKPARIALLAAVQASIDQEVRQMPIADARQQRVVALLGPRFQ